MVKVERSLLVLVSSSLLASWSLVNSVGPLTWNVSWRLKLCVTPWPITLISKRLWKLTLITDHLYWRNVSESDSNDSTATDLVVLMYETALLASGFSLDDASVSLLVSIAWWNLVWTFPWRTRGCSMVQSTPCFEVPVESQMEEVD